MLLVITNHTQLRWLYECNGQSEAFRWVIAEDTRVLLFSARVRWILLSREFSHNKLQSADVRTMVIMFIFYFWITSTPTGVSINLKWLLYPSSLETTKITTCTFEEEEKALTFTSLLLHQPKSTMSTVGRWIIIYYSEYTEMYGKQGTWATHYTVLTKG